MKKGQITVFIIIGIILLLSLGVMIYLQQVRVEKFETAILVVEEVAAEMMPVRTYIEDCLQETGKDALKKVGDYGGYISKDKFSFNPIEPTEGDGVQFAPKSDLVIPFWYHLKSKNTCTGSCEFSSARPELFRTSGKLSIQQQVEEYVAEKLNRCINNFLPFQQLMTFEELGPPQVEATITQDDVQFLIDWPLKVERAGQTFRLNKHTTTVSVSLQFMYTMATEIANSQAELRVFEYHTKQLIDVFGRISRDALPPTGELDFEFGLGTFWVKNDVEKKLKQILQSYIPMLQVGSTKNYKFLEAPAGVRDPKLYET